MKPYATYFENEWDGGVSFRAAEWERGILGLYNIRCYELVNDDYELKFTGSTNQMDKAIDAAREFAINGEIHHMLRRIN